MGPNPICPQHVKALAYKSQLKLSLLDHTEGDARCKRKRRSRYRVSTLVKLAADYNVTSSRPCKQWLLIVVDQTDLSNGFSRSRELSRIALVKLPNEWFEQKIRIWYVVFCFLSRTLVYEEGTRAAVASRMALKLRWNASQDVSRLLSPVIF